MGEIETVRDLRRTQIIREARKIVADEGLEALTIARLEKRVAFTRGVITYHFDNKAEIVRAVLESAVAEIDHATSAQAGGSDSLFEKLRAAIDANVRGFLTQIEATRVLFSFWSRLGSDPGAAELNASLYRRYREQAAALFRAGQRAGVMREDARVDAIAALVVGTVIGVVTQVHFDPGSVDPDAMIDEAAHALYARLLRPE